MLVALTRRRSLLVALALVVAIGGFVLPAAAGSHAHCGGPADQHCAPALPSVGVLPGPDRLGWVEPAETTASSLLVLRPILKIPLSA